MREAAKRKFIYYIVILEMKSTKLSKRVGLIIKYLF